MLTNDDLLFLSSLKTNNNSNRIANKEHDKVVNIFSFNYFKDAFIENLKHKDTNSNYRGVVLSISLNSNFNALFPNNNVETCFLTEEAKSSDFDNLAVILSKTSKNYKILICNKITPAGVSLTLNDTLDVNGKELDIKTATKFDF